MPTSACLVTVFSVVAISLLPARADAEPIVASAESGIVYLDKQAATPITGLSALAGISAGVSVHPRAIIKSKLFGFRADGTNLVLALAADLDIVREFVGVSIATGFSRGALSRSGNFMSAGLYTRLPLTRAIALRLEGSANIVARNDFSGLGASASIGLELSWHK